MDNYFTQNRSRKNIIFSWLPAGGTLCRTAGRLIVATSIAIGLTACGGAQDADLRSYVKEVKLKKKGRIPPLPEPQIFEIYAYNETSLRDPFIATQVLENADSGLRPDSAR